MLGKIKAWRAKRRADRKSYGFLLALYRMEYPDINPPHERYVIRQLTDDVLHHLLVKAEQGGHAREKISIERELRRRDAWTAPAGKAYWISVFALLISLAALIVSLLGQMGAFK